jgi:hypothetical protein
MRSLSRLKRLRHRFELSGLRKYRAAARSRTQHLWPAPLVEAGRVAKSQHRSLTRGASITGPINQLLTTFVGSP